MSDERDPQTYAMIGACMEVHSVKGCGFHEKVYQRCLAVELGLRGIPFAREVQFDLEYKGHDIECEYIADFICYGEVILEAKAVDRLENPHRGQVINYLKASGLRRALLVNFGAERLEYERIVRNYG